MAYVKFVMVIMRPPLVEIHIFYALSKTLPNNFKFGIFIAKQWIKKVGYYTDDICPLSVFSLVFIVKIAPDMSAIRIRVLEIG